MRIGDMDLRFFPRDLVMGGSSLIASASAVASNSASAWVAFGASVTVFLLSKGLDLHREQQAKDREARIKDVTAIEMLVDERVDRRTGQYETLIRVDRERIDSLEEKHRVDREEIERLRLRECPFANRTARCFGAAAPVPEGGSELGLDQIDETT